MAKQKAKTVDMSVSQEDLDKVILPEEAEAHEKARLKELEAAAKAEKEAKKAAKTAAKEAIQPKIEDKAEEEAKKPKKSRTHSQTYRAVYHLVDRTKNYPLTEAISLVQKVSYTSFPGTITADLVVKDQKVSAQVTFPHSTGQSRRVVIATDTLLKQIEAGQIDFDVLIATPAMMDKIAKLAKILGPKGLMPNPKNQTVTTDPEKRQKELEAGQITLKTEKKAPLMHVTLGKTNFKASELVANTESLIKALNPKKILKLTLSATMSPGVKVDLSPYQT